MTMQTSLAVQPQNQNTGPVVEDDQSKWFNSTITYHEGNLAEIRSMIPEFERRAFSLPQPNHKSTRINDHLDTIVRRPFGDDQTFVPVGVVSKNYALVSHLAVVNAAEKALAKAEIDSENVEAELKLTAYGERMALSLYLPKKYDYNPGDGNRMSMRLECFNSVDGSSRFRALVGWFRLVCSNGLIIGVTKSELRRRHVGDLSINDIAAVLTMGIGESDNEKQNFERWRKQRISPEELKPWINGRLKKDWGFKAAARFFHIAHTGCDAKIVGPYKDNVPTSIPVKRAQRVPGTPEQCNNLYDISQALAWLAKERNDVQEQLAWRESIQELLAPLAG